MGSLQGYDGVVARINAVTAPLPRQRICQRWQVATIRGAKLRVPRRTGNLGRSIHAGTVTETGAQVVASADHASYVELGTRAHDIQPKAGRIGRNGRPAALAWGGARRLSGSLRSGASPTSFARRVHHPGTAPHPFLRPAAEEALTSENLTDEFIVAWNNAA